MIGGGREGSGGDSVGFGVGGIGIGRVCVCESGMMCIGLWALVMVAAGRSLSRGYGWSPRGVVPGPVRECGFLLF